MPDIDIKDSRKRFENKSVQDPLPELSTEEWLASCSAPLGMNDAGELFDLEPMLQRELHSVKGTNF